MATIKLGSLTLGNVAIGGTTIGDTRKLGKSKIFRAQSLANHDVGKTITSVIGNDTPTPPVVDSNWLLSSGYWNDNGVWDDTQNWND